MKKLFKYQFFMVYFLFVSQAAFAQEGHPDKKRVDLLVLGGTVVTMNPDRAVIENGGVAVDQGIIVDVGPIDEIEDTYFSDQVIEAHGKAVIPGLINGHNHLAMSLFRGLADDLDLEDWLFNYIFPAEARNVDEDFVRAGTRLGLSELIRGGTTTFVDMYFFEDAVAEETEKAGVRGILGQGLIDFPSPDSPTFDEGLVLAEKFIEKWQNNSLITPALAPHTTYTVSEGHLRSVSELASRKGTPILIHVSETIDEINKVEKATGLTPIAYLERIGLLNNPVIAAHIVYPKNDEIPMLKNYNVGVIHNVHSNLKLASGVAPIPDLLKEDIHVGLGTDGAASNNDLSIWDEMDAAAKIHKGFSKNPKVVSAKEAFEMATIRGASAIHMDKWIGSIEKGKKADIAIVDLDGIHQIPRYNIYSALVYTTKASDVSTVVIDGKPVMVKRKLLTLDEEEIRKETYFLSEKIKKSINLY